MPKSIEDMSEQEIAEMVSDALAELGDWREPGESEQEGGKDGEPERDREPGDARPYDR